MADTVSAVTESVRPTVGQLMTQCVHRQLPARLSLVNSFLVFVGLQVAQVTQTAAAAVLEAADASGRHGWHSMAFRHNQLCAARIDPADAIPPAAAIAAADHVICCCNSIQVGRSSWRPFVISCNAKHGGAPASMDKNEGNIQKLLLWPCNSRPDASETESSTRESSQAWEPSKDTKHLPVNAQHRQMPANRPGKAQPQKISKMT